MPVPVSATAEEGGAARGRRGERDRAAVGHVAQRVGDQVLDDLLEAIRIAGELIGVGRDVGADGDRSPQRLVLVPPHHALEHPRRREDAHVERPGAVLDAGEIDEVGDDPFEPHGLVHDGAEIAVRGDRPAGRRRPSAASRDSRASTSAASSARATRRRTAAAASAIAACSAASRAASSALMWLKARATIDTSSRPSSAARVPRSPPATRRAAASRPARRRRAGPTRISAATAVRPSRSRKFCGDSTRVNSRNTPLTGGGAAITNPLSTPPRLDRRVGRRAAGQRLRGSRRVAAQHQQRRLPGACRARSAAGRDRRAVGEHDVERAAAIGLRPQDGRDVDGSAALEGVAQIGRRGEHPAQLGCAAGCPRPAGRPSR